MLWFLLWSLLVPFTQGFNLDTKSPIIFKSNNPRDYFGFSVGLHRNRDGPVALIGAPRANSSKFGEIHQPGVLYKCDVEKSNLPCQEIELDKKGNVFTARKDYSFMDRRDNMWLGVSLDIQRNSIQNDIVTCGHRWIDQYHTNHYLVNGACYVINENLDQNGVMKLVPLVDISRKISNGVNKFYMGQLGTSASFSEDGNYLHLGAPGSYYWTGIVASYASYPGMKIEYNSTPAAPMFSGDPNKASELYIGYSVTSGKFYGDGADYVAAGAPRDGDFSGCVYIYKAVMSGLYDFSFHQKIEGLEFGEYFGATVLGIDLNNDGYTDLLVGSPLYSSDSVADRGRVYVYISNKLWRLELRTKLNCKTKSPARFGTAFASAGDLNQDGFNDFIIGAPYEDEKGAIYIYHGSKTGVNDQYVQKISAVEIDSSLAGFGIQISRGFDIDLNQYPDILVGSYSSSKAVLFRSRPVVRLSSQISVSPNQINTAVTNCEYQNQKLSCVNVTVCLQYQGKHVPMYLEFEHDVFVDKASAANPVTPRGFFVSEGKSVTAIEEKSILKVGENNCLRYLLYIRNSTKDVINPIQILYRYNISESRSIFFNKSHPIKDPLSKSNITSYINFQTGCGSDEKCHSDLRIKAVILGQTNNKTAPMVIGRHSTLSLSIVVDNIGEPAHLSKLLIYLPPELPIISIKCSELSEMQSERNVSFVCDLGNLLTNQKVEILVKLDLDNIPTDKKELDINLKALTYSIEVNPDDSYVNIPLFFKAVADISITGSSSQEQIPYDVKNEEKVSIPVSHTYYVMNHGPSPVQVIDIKLWIPTTFEGKDTVEEFVTFTSLEADRWKSTRIPAECNSTYLKIKPSLTDITNTHDGFFNFSDLVPQYYSSNYTEESILSRFRRSSEKKSERKSKDVAINCETANCMAIECSASPFIESKKFAKISLSLLLNMSLVNKHVDPWFQIEFVTQGEVKIRDDKIEVIQKHHKTEVKTVIVNSIPPSSEEVDQWIIFLSIGIGLLLLLLILVLLVKFGFFKRENKEKWEKMKSEDEDCKDNAPCEGENTESEALN